MTLPREDLRADRGEHWTPSPEQPALCCAHNTRGTYCLAEDDVPPQGQHQTLGQAVRQFLEEHEGQGLLGAVHHFLHAVLQGQDEGVQLLVPVLWEGEGGKNSGIGDRRSCKVEPMYYSFSGGIPIIQDSQRWESKLFHWNLSSELQMSISSRLGRSRQGAFDVLILESLLHWLISNLGPAFFLVCSAAQLFPCWKHECFWTSLVCTWTGAPCYCYCCNNPSDSPLALALGHQHLPLSRDPLLSHSLTDLSPSSHTHSNQFEFHRITHSLASSLKILFKCWSIQSKAQVRKRASVIWPLVLSSLLCQNSVICSRGELNMVPQTWASPSPRGKSLQVRSPALDPLSCASLPGKHASPLRARFSISPSQGFPLTSRRNTTHVLTFGLRSFLLLPTAPFSLWSRTAYTLLLSKAGSSLRTRDLCFSHRIART